jgi:hypothetical protein
MLFLVISWICVVGLWFIIGSGILSLLKEDVFKRAGDHFIISVWTGALTSSVGLLALSLFLPLTSFTGAVAAVCAATGFVLKRRVRTALKNLLSAMTVSLIGAVFALIVGIAALMTKPVIYSDTGLYHYGIIEWLSHYGTIPGLALIHWRFGLVSSWLTFIAPFESGWFEGRIGSLGGGLALLILALHVIIALKRVLRNRAGVGDYFVVCAYTISITIAGFYLPRRFDLVRSPSPDVPVMIIIIVVSWLFLLLTRKDSSLRHSSREDHSFDGKMILLVLAAGAVAIKLNAMPLLAAVLIYIVAEEKKYFRRLLYYGLALVCMLLPLIAAEIVTSGCLFYPSGLVCVNLPWAVGKHIEDIALAHVTQFSRGGIGTDFSTFLRSQFTGLNMLNFLVLCSLLSGVMLFHRKARKRIENALWIGMVAILGILFTLYEAPLVRYMIGYLSILPALFIGSRVQDCRWGDGLLTFGAAAFVFCGYQFREGYQYHDDYLLLFAFMGLALFIKYRKIDQQSESGQRWLSYRQKRSDVIADILIVMVSCVIFVHSFEPFPYRKILTSLDVSSLGAVIGYPDRLMLPPHVMTAELERKKVNDVEYWSPTSKDSNCWSAKQPCTPYLTFSNIKLRDSNCGIQCGFMVSNR